MIRQLFKNQAYYELISELKRRSIAGETTYLLSLIYRYLGMFKEEKNLVDKNSEILDSRYLEHRKKWYKKPILEQMEERPNPGLPRNLDFIPKPEILEKTCLVLMSSSKYYMSLVGQIMSIKATQTYKDIPIFIFDMGLSSSEKNQLSQLFSINENMIKKAKWDWEVITVGQKLKPDRVDNQNWGNDYYFPSLVGATWSQRYVPELYFPGYRYYFQLEADGWVQNESCFGFLAKQRY